jgi:DNA mismatch repair ATPase MutL
MMQWGMDISRISEQDIMLRSLPTLMQEVDGQALVKVLVEKQPGEVSQWINSLSQLAAEYDKRSWTQDAMQMLLNELSHYQLWQQTQAADAVWRQLDEARLARLFND